MAISTSQYAQLCNYNNYNTSVTYTTGSGLNLGYIQALCQQQAVQKPAKKFLDELRDEISGWHGSLGAL